MPAFPVMNTWRFECSITSRALRNSGLISTGILFISQVVFRFRIEGASPTPQAKSAPHTVAQTRSHRKVR